ncbi:outer membrane lipid asymmetry maintenance protein MlaD [Roseateles paludis]|uniref:Outer membrane lipid asymmetry maintenance protein MlaD n=1 Tax=Roseateles paludis TaxID=3145238 RepID=A0ABV0G4K7_9BURK
MAKKSIEVMVGLFVLLGMLGLVFLALKAANLGGAGGGDTYTLQARFDNIGGLKARAPVRTAGVTIGRVSTITLDAKTYQGLVIMEIQKGFEFPKDTSAKILTAGLLGDQYIGLEAGADEKNLVAGDTIRQTQSAVVLESLIGQFLNSKASDLGSATPASGGAK